MHFFIVEYPNVAIVGRTTTKKEQRSGNTLYQELSFQDNEESEEHEVTGKFNIHILLLQKWKYQ